MSDGRFRAVPVEERFWSKVSIPRDVVTGCWAWTGARMRQGSYGHFRLGDRAHGAHRIAWELLNGPIPDGMHLRHVACDNPPCVNPVHLALGTHADNMADKVRAGRQPRVQGEKNPTATLSEDAVRRIRERWSQGEKQSALAAEFGVTRQAIWRICHHVGWRHVP